MICQPLRVERIKNIEPNRQGWGSSPTPRTNAVPGLLARHRYIFSTLPCDHAGRMGVTVPVPASVSVNTLSGNARTFLIIPPSTKGVRGI